MSIKLLRRGFLKCVALSAALAIAPAVAQADDWSRPSAHEVLDDYERVKHRLVGMSDEEWEELFAEFDAGLMLPTWSDEQARNYCAFSCESVRACDVVKPWIAAANCHNPEGTPIANIKNVQRYADAAFPRLRASCLTRDEIFPTSPISPLERAILENGYRPEDADGICEAIDEERAALGLSSWR